MVIAALFRALPSIFHPAARRLLGKTLALTFLIFTGLAALLWWGFHAVRMWLGWDGGGYAEAAATMLAIVVAGWLLFRATAMAVMSLFADDIVEAVERDSYPEAARTARPVGWAKSFRLAIASLARTMGWNLVALPLYIALLVTGIGTVGLFLLINAYLLGRDLADMVQPRHPALVPLSRGNRWLMGLASAILFLIPLVNLLAPIWSAAMAVHMLLGAKRKM